MSTIFAKIIRGELPCHKVWEDDDHLAFLDIRPINAGHTLVIPKKNRDYIFDLSNAEYEALWQAAKTVAEILKAQTGCQRVVTLVLGYEVHHTHIHLIPTQSERDVIPYVPKPMSHEDLARLANSLASPASNSTPTTSNVRDFWDSFAKVFSEKHQPTTLKLAKSAMDHLQLETATSVLEIGGGAGASAAELYKRIDSSAELTTTDLSSQMISIAKSVLDERINIQQADAEQLPFKDGQFDRVFANLNLMIVPRAQRALHEAARVLQPDGIGVWTVWGRKEHSPLMTLFSEAAAAVGIQLSAPLRSNFHLNSKTRLKEMLTKAGFNRVQLWYQPMVSPYEDAQSFTEDAMLTRPEIEELDAPTLKLLRDELLSRAAAYFDQNTPLSLEVLVIRARRS